MARITSMADLSTRELRHKFFNYSCQALEPNNHVFYYCVQQFDANPSKRKAIFIFDTFLKELLAESTGGTVGGDLDAAYDLLRQVNVYDKAQYDGQITRIGAAVGNIKKVKTWTGKLFNRGLVAEYAQPKAGMFAAAQKQIEGLMRSDWFRAFDTNTTAVVPGKFPVKIQKSSQTLTSVGFDPDEMGVY